MKLINLVLILFAIISIKSEDSLNSYSINTFIKYLKDNKLFEIIKSIKMAYGPDVAIITCEELNKSMKGYCQRLILEHLNELSISSKEAYESMPSNNTFNKKIISRKSLGFIKNSNRMPYIIKYLNEKYNPEKSLLIYKNIIEKYDEFFKGKKI